MRSLNPQRIQELSLWDSLLLENSPKLPKRTLEHLPTNEQSLPCNTNFLKNILEEVHPFENQFKTSILGRLNFSFEEEDISTNIESSSENVECQGNGNDTPPNIDNYLDTPTHAEQDTEGPVQANQQIEETIFKHKNIKKGWKKNTNVPKFLVRVYLKHFTTHNSHKKDKKFYETHKKARKEMKKVSNNNFKISHILRLLEDEDTPNDVFEQRNRDIMSRILRNSLREQVIDNPYIGDNKLSYLIASKIYALRCRAKGLAERVQVF